MKKLLLLLFISLTGVLTAQNPDCDPSFTTQIDPNNNLLYHFQATDTDTINKVAYWGHIQNFNSPGPLEAYYGINGNPLRDPTFSYLFPERGYYTMGRRVYNPLLECFVQEYDTLNVGNIQLDANFTFELDSSEILSSIRYKLITYCDPDINIYYSLDGGNYYDLNGTTALSVHFTTPGFHTVCIATMNNVGIPAAAGELIIEGDTLCNTVYIEPSLFDCNPNFTYAFDTSYSIVTLTPVDLYLHVNRDWNINGIDIGENIAVFPASPGDTLIITQLVLNTYSVCMSTFTDTLILPLPVVVCNAGFTYLADTLTGLISFTSTATGTVDNHLWQFTSSTISSTSTDVNPTFQASLGDSVDVTYIVSAVGCSDTIIQQVILPPPPVVTHQLEGCAYVESQDAGDALVYLLKYEYGDGEIVVADSVFTNDGCYFFDDIANGDYIVKAILDENNPLVATTLPSYHTSHEFWTGADIITIASSTPQANINIDMLTGTNPGGPGFISGSVDWADTLRAAVDFSNSTVIVKNANGSIVAYTMAQSSGNYTIANLPLGTYNLFADYAGYSGNPKTVTLTTNTPSSNDVSLLLGPALVSVKEENAISGIVAYPNPFTDMVTLQIDSKINNRLTYNIVNPLGQVVYQSALQIQPGKNNLELSLGALAQGIYSIQLTDGKKYTGNIKIVKY